MVNVDTNTLFQDKCNFEKTPTEYGKAVSETHVIKMFEFLIDNMGAMLGEFVFQQTVGIPINTNCAPLLVDS